MMNEVDDSFYSSSVPPSPSKSPEIKRSTSELDLDNYSDSIQVDDPLINNEKIQYSPIEYHWFYTIISTERLIWLPFSFKDSSILENVYSENLEEIKKLRNQLEIDRLKWIKSAREKYVISVKGGRFEVDLLELEKRPVYWIESKSSHVCRCLWFYKESNDQRYFPYDEEYSKFLEKEYERTIKKSLFHKRIDYQPRNKKQINEKLTRDASLTNEEAFVFHSTNIMLHYTQATMLDEFGNLNSDAQRPRVVKRGLIEVVDKVETDENEDIDHLCFVVHGIGEACDLKFRPIEECVDDFREIGSDITQSHLKQYIESSEIYGRTEFLPISWHQDLHGDQTGIDERLKPMSLPSIPKLREFSNTTLLDVLFYTSPIYCQTIINKVGNELNRLCKIFHERNPSFKGTISLIGHSLGSLILFDLLSNQITSDQNAKTNINNETENNLSTIDISEKIEEFLESLDLSEYKEVFVKEKVTMKSLPLLTEYDLLEMGIPLGPRRIIINEAKTILFNKEKENIKKQIQTDLCSRETDGSFKNGLAGTGQFMVKYPQLNFKVKKFFALGSPIAMFQTVRGIERIETDFKFPTCEEFFNIFHPFDPVAYRFEPLICNEVILKPVLMSHHKGRKRMHIELREGLTKVGGDMLKVGGDIIKNAWSTFSDTQAFFKGLQPNTHVKIQSDFENSQVKNFPKKEKIEEKETENNEKINTESEKTVDQIYGRSCNFGNINKGNRIDYVLQERPIETFNEYLFALASHACYWESEDTVLLIIKQVYGYEDTLDSNVELNLTENQQQQTSWLTQMATQAISSNVQKTFSYFQMGLSQSLTNVLPSTSTSASLKK